MYILAVKCKGIHNFVNHDKYKGYGCTRIHEPAREARNEGVLTVTANAAFSVR